MLNRRKAMIGWMVYTAAKPFVKRAMRSKAKAAVPGTREGSSKTPNNAAILAAIGAAVAGLLFFRNRGGGDDSESGEE